jgi:two-component system, OmpR family, phosphate regulon response regulator PhoB
MRDVRVFVIDDDEDIRSVMCFALEFEGLSTLALGTATEALSYLRSLSAMELPDLIIVDYSMPDMTGLDFIATLRQQYPQDLGRIPVVLSSARSCDHLREEGLPDDVIILEKPLDLGEFIYLAKSFGQGPLKVASF